MSERSVVTWLIASKAKAKSDRDTRILNLAESGMTQEQIAADVGVEQKTVSRVMGQQDNVAKIADGRAIDGSLVSRESCREPKDSNLPMKKFIAVMFPSGRRKL